MFRLHSSPSYSVDEFEAFIETINRRRSPFDRLFRRSGDLFLARAPGRLDVLGGIADYSGSLVLQLPLAAACFVALQRDSTGTLRVISDGADDVLRSSAFEMPLADLAPGGKPVSYAAARTFFKNEPRDRWAAYVIGAFLVLMHERDLRFLEGARVAVSSAVPEAKGVSSSAALEVSTMQAIVAAYNVPIEAEELAALCQKVENLVVGAPCGIMDQMTSTCGEADRLLVLRCQPATLEGHRDLAADLQVWGIDSGVRHEVSGADYSSVRIGSFMGYRIVAQLAGLETLVTPQGQLQVDDPLWNGYLANVTPEEFEARFMTHIPDSLLGAEFIQTYQGITDHVTSVDRRRRYAVQVPTKHPIYENARVSEAAGILGGDVDEASACRLGELMLEGHRSYSACGLGSAATDRIVELVQAVGPEGGLFGARITGGGSGGTVAVLGLRGVADRVETIAEQYRCESGCEVAVLSGSSMGASRTGTGLARWSAL